MLYVKLITFRRMIWLCLALCFIIPALAWHYSPLVIFALVNECQTHTVNVIQGKSKTMVIHRKWWLRPDVTQATGTYSARAEVHTPDGIVFRDYMSKAFQLEYQIAKRNLDIHMINVSHLDDGNDASAVEERYADPLMQEGLRVAVHIFRLPGGAIMSGLNDRPRFLCR